VDVRSGVSACDSVQQMSIFCGVVYAVVCAML
jgi:hypothetical protein